MKPNVIGVTIVLVVVSLSITWLVSLALMTGHDGAIFQGGITALGGTGVLGVLKLKGGRSSG